MIALIERRPTSKLFPLEVVLVALVHVMGEMRQVTELWLLPFLSSFLGIDVPYSPYVVVVVPSCVTGMQSCAASLFAQEAQMEMVNGTLDVVGMTEELMEELPVGMDMECIDTPGLVALHMVFDTGYALMLL